MAHYLKRAFGDDPEISVLNGIRLEYQSDSAQIDHLIIHKYGMIIVESKSVTGEVVINKYGEWARQFESMRGMPSPIKQAERQGAFLKKYLDRCGPELPRDFGIQRKFEKLPVNMLVAISDKAIIRRTEGWNSDDVCKADLIPDRINKIIQDYQKGKSFLSFSVRPFTLSDDTRKELSAFLIQAHVPLVTTGLSRPKRTTPAKPEKRPQTQTDYHCTKCSSTNIKILWGQYEYYFKCNECKQNTPIKQLCPTCNRKVKLRKDKDEFYAECASCGESNLFYTNPS